MKYITHHRYKELALCGIRLNLPYGTEMQTKNDYIITLDGKPVCLLTSENAKLHFARNNDGCGLERGMLTYAIAYSKRVRHDKYGRQQRFSDDEIEMLEKDWSHFLRKDVDVILFNDNFFMADVDELRKFANALHMKIS